MFSDHSPTTPARLHALAKEILDELRDQPAAAAIILGGGVALQHYCEYRDTQDIDAWWKSNPTTDTQQLLKETMERVAKRHGYTLSVRTWGETQSLELQDQGKTVFSFQVAVRSVELEPPGPSAWPPVQLETLHLDRSVYPDEAPPTEFLTIHQQADYVHRIVSAFDFGLPPDAATLHLFSRWLEVFDAFPLPASPGYHALRSYFGWQAVGKEPFPSEPVYLKQDSVKGRIDGCEELV